MMQPMAILCLAPRARGFSRGHGDPGHAGGHGPPPGGPGGRGLPDSEEVVGLHPHERGSEEAEVEVVGGSRRPSGSLAF